MSSHQVTLDSTAGLVNAWHDLSCSCGWRWTTLAPRTAALAVAEQHLDDSGADVEDFDSLCSL
jgi:hypothetical protein